jgi:hypothetical protein
MPALNRFADLLGKGIRIVTLSDGQEYDSESINNLTGLIVPLVTMARANEESEMKSKRLREAWKQKKAKAADGEVLTARVPAWLRVRDGKLEVVKRRAKVVRRIFDLAAAGHGKAAIARQLNVEGVAPFGNANGWHKSYVAKILDNPAVIGRYQPHRNTYVDGKRVRVPEGDPVEGYFPPVVEPSLFYSIKHSKPGPSGKGDHPPRNVLSGLAFCARCGGKMHYVNKGRSHQYLACDNARRKRTCDAPAVPYGPLLDGVLDQVRDFRDIEPNSSAAKERDRELDALGGQIEEAEEAIERILDLVEKAKSPRAVERLEVLEAKLAALKARREKLEEEEIARGNHIPPGTVYETFLDTSPRILPGPNSDRDLIAHIGAEIRRQVERIEIEKGQPIKVTPKTGLTFEEKEPAVELVGRRTKPVKVIPRSDG